MRLTAKLEASKDPGGVLRDSLKQAAVIYGRQLTQDLESAQADLKAQAATLKQREVGAAVKASPDAAKLVQSLQASLQQRGKQLTEEAQTLQKALKQIPQDLDSMK
jgi:hypothetical protein